jgi:hypothetical protein
VGASAKPIIVGGSLLAAVYTVANALALYYAKAYLIDRPALSRHAGRADWADGGPTLPVGHAGVLKTTVCGPTT